jgi:hypothetical protein
MSFPAATQRQPRRMHPSAIVKLDRRHEKWTSHLIIFCVDAAIVPAEMNGRLPCSPEFPESGHRQPMIGSPMVR